ncbi:MAG: peptidoglycan DD-metalloendopeptidase family protein [Pseudomonadales bacterium]|nr:peptidoglycan DD-metalloendopeptidase family protein [Pseudomonadales bacterium]
MLIVILTCLVATPTDSFGSSNSEIQKQESELSTIEKNINSISRWLKHALSKRDRLIAELEQSEQNISQLVTQQRRLTTKIEANKTRLNELNNKMEQLERDLGTQRGKLAQQIRIMHAQGEKPALKVLLDIEDMGSASRVLTYLEYINAARLETLKTFRQAQQNLYDTQAAVNNARQQLIQHQKTLDNRIASYQNETQKRERILASLTQELSTSEARLKHLQANRENLEKAIEKAKKKYRARRQSANSGKPFATLRTKLPWPTHGKVTRGYRSHLAGPSLRSNGILVEAPVGTTVSAIHDGRVVFADWIRGFGLMLIIDHGSGFMSLYGQNYSLLKDAGDTVAAGDPIATTGNSGGARESGLYFEIRKNGKPENPTKWLKKQ